MKRIMKKRKYDLPCIEIILVPGLVSMLEPSKGTGFTPGVVPPGDGGEDNLDGDTSDGHGNSTHGNP